LDPAHLARAHIDEFDCSGKCALGADENGATGEGDGRSRLSPEGKREEDEKNATTGKNLEESAARNQGNLLRRESCGVGAAASQRGLPKNKKERTGRHRQQR
jgi:hypothetical protein